jgi:hypothetical protein
MKRDPPKCEVCQIRARELQVWAFWQIWCDEETVTYVLSTAVGGPIPSLATIFNNLQLSSTPSLFHFVPITNLGLPEFVSDGAR